MIGGGPPTPPPPPNPPTRADASRLNFQRPLIGGNQPRSFLAPQPAQTGGRRSLLGAAN